MAPVGQRPLDIQGTYRLVTPDIRRNRGNSILLGRPEVIHRFSVDVVHGLVLLFGIGTKALVHLKGRPRGYPMPPVTPMWPGRAENYGNA